MSICIIPARSGSKRIHGKNIKMFCGKPMITWPIQAAIESGCFEKIIVTTDDEEIASVARGAGAETPFLRPKNLADDHTATRPVINHAIRFIQTTGLNFEKVCCIYATSPFLTANVLRDSKRIFLMSGAEFLFSAASYPAPIQRSFRILPDGTPERLWPQYRQTRSQDLEAAYHDAGQFYWGNVNAFLNNLDSVSAKSRAYVLPRTHAHDIDTQEDWDLAELVFLALRKPEEHT